MPTEPSKALLDRAAALAQGAAVTAPASALLRELANYATVSFERCVHASTAMGSEDVAPLILYLHVIEMMDGIEILLGQCAPNPAHPLLRSSFEAVLSLEYVLEDKTNYAARSLSWLLVRLHEEIAALERLDPSTETGKQFQAVAAKDQLTAGANIGLPPQADVQKEIARLTALLTEAEFQPIEAEYIRLTTTERRRPEWSRLFGGPRNLIDLAHHLKRGAQYDMLYRSWSNITHAQDYSRFLRRAGGGGIEVARLRNHDGVRYVIELAAPMLLDIIEKMARQFLPVAEYPREWFIKEVAPLYKKL